MKNENTDKILKDIRTLICNKFDFSFSIDQNLGIYINYNEGKGTAKLTIDESLVGAHSFVSELMKHENCKGHEIHPIFWEKIKPGEAKVKDYKKVKETIFFDGETFKQIKAIDYTNENLRKAEVFETDRFFGVKILKSKGYRIAVLFDDYVFTIDWFEGQKDKIQAAIEFLCERFIDGAELTEFIEMAIDSRTLTALHEQDEKRGQNQGSGAKLYIEDSVKVKGQAKKRVKKEAENSSVDYLINKALTAKDYTVLNKAIYFNNRFMVVKKDETKKQNVGRLVRPNDFKEVVLVSHKKIDDSSVSLLYKGFLYEFEDMTEGGDQIQKAIDLIKTKGLNTILKMAEEDLPAAA